MTDLDLFGAPLPQPPAVTPRTGKVKRKTIPKGYAARPGSGPRGETCGSCNYAYRRQSGTRAYWKCGLVTPTNGPGTDIRFQSPACQLWTPEVER